MTHTRMLAAAAALLLVASSLEAQVPNASVAAFGMAGNYTAAATGYEVVAWNPAMFALPGGTKFSFTIGSVGGFSGLNPVTLGDVAKFDDRTIDAATREAWLQRIGTGTERGMAEGGVTLLALSMGRLAIQLGATGAGAASLNQDAAEAILFGNAGRPGQPPRTLRFNGSNARGDLFATGAASVAEALPWHFGGDTLAFGITGKFIAGSGAARAQDNGSVVTPGSVTLAFPILYTSDAVAGMGGGVDVGLAWRKGATTLGLTVQNAFNSFSWDTTKFRAKLGTATFDGLNYNTNFDDTTYSAAPAEMRQAIENEKFTPTIGFGVALRPRSSLLLTADVRQQTGTGIEIGPRSHVGIGAEFTGLEFLPLRAGVAKISDGWQAAAGVGFRFWHLDIGVAGSVRDRNGERENGAMVSAFAFR
jgi:hypothetical protein